MQARQNRSRIVAVVQNPDGFRRQYLNGTDVSRVHWVDVPGAIQIANNRTCFPAGVGSVLISDILGWGYRSGFRAQAHASGVDWKDMQEKLPERQVAEKLLGLLSPASNGHVKPPAGVR